MTNDNDVIANMLNAAPVCGSVWDREGRSVVCNDAALRFFGLASKQTWLDHYAELSPVCQLGGEASGPLLLAHLRKAFAEGRTEFSWQHCRLDGQIIPAQVSLTRVYQGGDEWVVAYATLQPAQVPHHTIDNWDDEPMRAEFVRDLREQTREQAEKHETAERQQIMFDAAAASITFWSWDDKLKLIDCNQEAANFFELGSKQEYIDHFFELSPEYQPSGRLSSELAHEHIATAFRDGYTRFEWMHQKLNGEPVPAEITLVRIQRAKGCIVAGYARDLRELRNSAASLKRLETLAYTDKLTGISTRHHFLEQATATLGNLSVSGSACLLLLDIDHFKRINDTYGHSGGDTILRSLAARIQDTPRPDDLFTRYGGEEFVILLGRAQLVAAIALAERIRETIECTLFEYHGHAIRVTISIGIADCGYPAPALQDMIDRADTALYQAKHDGRNRVEYSPHT